MTALDPTIQFFDGIPENLDGVSLRRHCSTGTRSVQIIFGLKSIERFNSFRKRFSNGLKLIDEGEISVAPSSVKFIFGGPEGDDFERLECQLEIDREDHWERFMRFMNRYADVNGLADGESQ